MKNIAILHSINFYSNAAKLLLNAFGKFFYVFF